MRPVARDDVLVVGAGPAGSATAAHLARAGVDVLVVDAAAFPRSKPCGDCLSPGADPLLEELGALDAVRAADPARLEGWRMRTPDGTWFEGRFAGDAGLALPREELDAALLEAALGEGASLRERIRVFDLLRDEGRVAGVRARTGSGEEVALRAGLVVGADGLRSVVARRLGGVRRGRRRRLALVGRFRGAGAGRGRPALGRMRISGEGCLGIAPVGGGRLNATLVVPASGAASISGDPEAFYFDRLRRYGATDDLADAELAGELEVTGPFEVAPRTLAAPGALLTGDAAGYFDPFTGQGVYRALASGRLAARTALELLSADDAPAREAARRRYAAGLQELLGPSRRVQRLVDHVVSRPWLIDRAGRILAALPGLASLLVDVTGDVAPAGSLVDPAALTAAALGRRTA